MDKELKTICSAEYNVAKERMHYSCAYNVAIEHLRHLPSNNAIAVEIRLLVNQFYYGIAAQKELFNKCVELKWIKL